MGNAMCYTSAVNQHFVVKYSGDRLGISKVKLSPNLAKLIALLKIGLNLEQQSGGVNQKFTVAIETLRSKLQRTPHHQLPPGRPSCTSG
ncbi:hypothetical protein Pint_21772 [Pistacia integerrima]|uniref:Uncharacterized protein n=1 Tax=Pistacia integerrima TaxID=434235 RepID=A0ACC0XCX6_9ROSI|nr:hypothetical protein Pint_21772 [Pistacia integerrima]